MARRQKQRRPRDQGKAHPAWAAPTPCLPSVAALRARRSGDSSRASLTRKFALKKKVPKKAPSLNSAQIGRKSLLLIPLGLVHFHLPKFQNKLVRQLKRFMAD